MFKNNFKVNFTAVNAADEFLGKLKGVKIQNKKEKLLEKNSLVFLQNLLKKMVLSNG